MAATVIDGKAVAASVRERVRGGVEELTGQLGRPPGLATVLVGDDPASAIYVRRKHEACEEVGDSLLRPQARCRNRPGGSAGAGG